VLLPTNLPVLHLAYRFSVLRCGIYIWQLRQMGQTPSEFVGIQACVYFFTRLLIAGY